MATIRPARRRPPPLVFGRAGAVGERFAERRRRRIRRHGNYEPGPALTRDVALAAASPALRDLAHWPRRHLPAASRRGRTPWARVGTLDEKSGQQIGRQGAGGTQGVDGLRDGAVASRNGRDRGLEPGY
ncbi:hypothetical protein ABU614_04320 [Lysobacter firmicutimachus]|uniref:Uncharacterized protein n=1 Tax=Lysobacter firmicutimachus TaxID=1792846 RepID=A0AAU8MUZ5_9GAMM